MGAKSSCRGARDGPPSAEGSLQGPHRSLSPRGRAARMPPPPFLTGANPFSLGKGREASFRWMGRRPRLGSLLAGTSW